MVMNPENFSILHTMGMADLFEIHSMINTIEDLHCWHNLTRSKITRMRRDGELFNIRRGLYINAQKYQSLPPWGKYAAHLIAYSRTAKNPVFSHQSAAVFHSLALITVSTKIHTYCPTDSRGSSKDVVKHPFLTEHTSLANNLYGSNSQLTSLLTTVIDCCTQLSFEEGVVLADSALRVHKIPQEILREAMLNYRGVHRERVHAVARAMSACAESAGESLTRLILNQLKLSYQEQHWFTHNQHRYRTDFFVEELNLIIEFDGDIKYEVFGPREAIIVGERLRERELLKSGYRIFRVDWNDVWRNPYRTMYQIRDVAEKIRQEKEPKNTQLQ